MRCQQTHCRVNVRASRLKPETTATATMTSNDELPQPQRSPTWPGSRNTHSSASSFLQKSTSSSIVGKCATSMPNWRPHHVI